jgi:quercetin dioxygenase-like cupin family protein
MKMRIVLFLIVALVAITGFNCSEKVEQNESEQKEDVLAGTIQGLKIDNIMTSQLELVEGTEVVVSHIEIPADTTLPKHWHPGEEFAYVLGGSFVLWQKDKSDTHLKKGDVFKVPLEQIHTVKTGKEGAKVLIFRVHKSGEPVRVIVE